MHTTSLLLGALASLALANPMPTPGSLHVRNSNSCTFTDASKAISAKKSCSVIVLKDITVPAGKTLDMTNLKDGTTVIFEGTTTFEYKEWKGPLISFSGNKIRVQGANGHLIDGNGAKWWDGKGSNGGKKKPKFFFAHKMTNSVINGLNIKNIPVHGFSINKSKNLALNGISLDNTDGDKKHGGHNTDAFDVGSSSQITITGANIKNQDDCLAINSGTDITFQDGSCSGGHGLSIGSVGGRSDNTVKNVKITRSSISDSENGVRIKTVYGAKGTVSGIEYSDIKLSGITKKGIVIEQDYENGKPTGKPTSGVPITDLTVKNVQGSVSSKATGIYILCAKGACKDWSWSGVSITGGKKSSKCSNVPDSASC